MRACSGARKPRLSTEGGMSCTTPSVTMMTPASRSGGTSASPLASAANRRVPSSPSPSSASMKRGSTSARLPKRRCSSARTCVGHRRPVAEGLRGRAVDHDRDDVLHLVALFLDEGGVRQRQERRGRGRARARSRSGRGRRARGRRAAATTAREAVEDARRDERGEADREQRTSPIARAARAAPARGPDRPCSCRSAHTSRC